MPSVRPFARNGLVQAGNPASDTIYVTPGEDLYSQQHPPSQYRIQLHYDVAGGGSVGTLNLGAVQLRKSSEVVQVDGVPLVRDKDYSMDYDLGVVTFTRPDTLFPRPRRVSVRYEENPLFAAAPTSILGLCRTDPARPWRSRVHGHLAEAEHVVHASAARVRAAVVVHRGRDGELLVRGRAPLATDREAADGPEHDAVAHQPAGRVRDEPAAAEQRGRRVCPDVRGRRRVRIAAAGSGVVLLEPASAGDESRAAVWRRDFQPDARIDDGLAGERTHAGRHPAAVQPDADRSAGGVDDQRREYAGADALAHAVSAERRRIDERPHRQVPVAGGRRARREGAGARCAWRSVRPGRTCRAWST